MFNKTITAFYLIQISCKKKRQSILTDIDQNEYSSRPQLRYGLKAVDGPIIELCVWTTKKGDATEARVVTDRPLIVTRDSLSIEIFTTLTRRNIRWNGLSLFLRR